MRILTASAGPGLGTAGGLSLTGMAMCNVGSADCQRQHAVNRSDAGAFTLESVEHPLMVGQVKQHTLTPPPFLLRLCRQQ